MVFETIALSVITVLLLLLMHTRKDGKIKLLLGVLSACCAIASLVFFLQMQKAAGRPAAGSELMQLYLPCGIYVLAILLGGVPAFLNYRKLKKAHDAKKALKASRAAIHKSAQEKAAQETSSDPSQT